MISICMIAKNEEKNIDKCLRPLQKLGYEIVVVDTGSTDRTKELVAKYTDKIYDFAWCDDFSAARNYAACMASGEWILAVDFDEYLERCIPGELEKFAKTYPKSVGMILRKNPHGGESGQQRMMTERVARFYPKATYEYVGRIHEQVSAKNLGEMSYKPLGMIFYHAGYESKEDLTRKAQRNLELLLKDLGEHPEDPYILYQTAKSYQVMKDYENALQYYDRALGIDVDPRLEYVQDMICGYGYSLLEKKEYERALGLEGIYEEFAHRAEFVFLMGLVYMNNGLFEQATKEFQKAATYEECGTEGLNGYLAHYNTAVIYECTGRIDEALVYYRKCGEYEPALKRIAELEG